MPLTIIISGVKSIEPNKYLNNKEITEVIIEEGVEIIGEKAFYGCSQLTNLTLPDKLKEIGKQAFSECYGITELRIPDTVTKIGCEAFCRCSHLTKLRLSKTLTQIGDGAFAGCDWLGELRLPDTLTKIGWFAFTFDYSCNYEYIWCSDNVAELLERTCDEYGSLYGHMYTVEEMRNNANPKVYLNRYYWNPRNHYTTFRFLNDTIKTLFLCAIRNDLTKFLPDMPEEMYKKILSMIRC